MRYVILFFLLLYGTMTYSQPNLDLRLAFQLGDLRTDSVVSIALGPANSVYSGGSFTGDVDFDPGPDVLELNNGNLNAEPFLAKYDVGGGFLWARHLVGRGEARDVAVDSQGNLIATGHFIQNLVLDMSTTLVSPTTAGSQFVVKYTSTGDLLWAFSLDTRSHFGVNYTVAIDDNNKIILGGSTALTVDLDPGAGTADVSPGPFVPDSFIAQYDENGGYLWGQVIREDASPGLSVSDTLNSLMIDSTGNIFAGGLYKGSSTFGITGNTETLVSAVADAFLLKLDSNGGLLWVRSTAGSGTRKEHLGIGMDALGNLYMTGMFFGEADFDPDPVAEVVATAKLLNAYILSFDSNGDFRWFGHIVSSTIAFPRDLHVSDDGSAMVVGGFRGMTDFDPGPGTLEFIAQSQRDPFFALYDSSGALIQASHFVANQNQNIASTLLSVASDGEGYWMSGSFQQTVDFDPSPDNSPMTSVLSSVDGFVARYGGGVFDDGFEEN